MIQVNKSSSRKQYCLLIYKVFRGESAHYVLIKDESMSLRAAARNDIESSLISTENISVNTCDDVIVYVSSTKELVWFLLQKIVQLFSQFLLIYYVGFQVVIVIK